MALVVACASFMAQLDSTVVLTALPAMAQTFAVAPVNLSITITIYIMVQAVCLPASAWIADRIGTRPIFIAAVSVFLIASILCGMSRTLPIFIAARVVQGLAAALMTPVGRIIMLKAAPKDKLISVVTISSIPMLIAPTIGPVVGGFFVTYFSWPWIFYLNIPTGVIGLLVMLRTIPNFKEDAKQPFDTRGFLLMGIALSSLLYGVERISAQNDDWFLSVSLLFIGTISLIAAIVHSRKYPHPIIALSALKVRTYFVATISGGAVIRISVRALSFVLPLMLQVTLGMTAFVAGLMVLALSAGDLLLKPIATRTIKRYGFRNVLTICAIGSATVVMLCATISSAMPLWLIFSILFVSGMFRSLLFGGASAMAFADIEHGEIARSSVLWNVSQQFTNALAVSIAAILMDIAPHILGEGTRGVVEDMLSLWDCRFALLALSIPAWIAAVSFFRLPLNAGAKASGHVG